MVSIPLGPTPQVPPVASIMSAFLTTFFLSMFVRGCLTLLISHLRDKIIFAFVQMFLFCFLLRQFGAIVNPMPLRGIFPYGTMMSTLMLPFCRPTLHSMCLAILVIDCAKKHLSDDTVALIVQKRKMFTRLKILKKTWRHHCLRSMLHAWKEAHHSIPIDRDFVRHCFWEITLTEENYRLASLRVCHSVRHDDEVFYRDLAEQTGEVAEHGAHRIWDAIRHVLPKWKNRR